MHILCQGSTVRLRNNRQLGTVAIERVRIKNTEHKIRVGIRETRCEFLSAESDKIRPGTNKHCSGNSIDDQDN